MPPRNNPTVRQARLGRELRRLRERAGKASREAAAMLSTDQAKISHIESGRNGISEDRIRRLATFYSCDSTALVDALCSIARERSGQFWWDEYRGVLPPGFLDIAALEHHATSLQYWQPVTIPGLFQTEDQARALFDTVLPKLPTSEVDARVEHRMRRKKVFERDTPTDLEAIVHEAALRMRIGGRKVARGQLEYLLEASEWPGVMLRVIPFSHESYIDVMQTVLYACGPVPQLDTVHIDNAARESYRDSPAELAKYRTHFDLAEQASMEPDESREFIRHIAREL
ncbi:helix-turn-helix domain-containing protein [Streptomyces montanisoli]|uniref:Helix-turn-helix transcriptional regulator n=1 Tax=Streptomyces montanisoli TaxID=2798581 RepID=A0A940RYG7_9ACTN|nr:helix-turn-helix transcriptional regulator [Streptomyces montanisoli]MBP0458664.1 helix-turn-helix transcriptional regulator [Streptomyces montanisoli]